MRSEKDQRSKPKTRMSKPIIQLLFDAQIHTACAMPHLLRLRENLSAIKDPARRELAVLATDLLQAAHELAERLEAEHEEGGGV